MEAEALYALGRAIGLTDGAELRAWVQVERNRIYKNREQEKIKDREERARERERQVQEAERQARERESWEVDASAEEPGEDAERTGGPTLSAAEQTRLQKKTVDQQATGPTPLRVPDVGEAAFTPEVLKKAANETCAVGTLEQDERGRADLEGRRVWSKTTRNDQVAWGPPQEAAFHGLKRLLAEASPQGAPVKAGVWRVASPRTPRHAGSLAHVWLCVAFPCLGKRASWWLSQARGRFGPFGAPRVRQYTTSAPASHRRESWEKCAKCGSHDHLADVCEGSVACANCRGPHPAYSRSCPLWRQEKEILSLRAKENLSYPEAKQRFSFISKGTYSDAVRRGPAPRTESRATQFSLEDLAGPSLAPKQPAGKQGAPGNAGSTHLPQSIQARPPADRQPRASSSSQDGERGRRSTTSEAARLVTEQQGPPAAPSTSKDVESVNAGGLLRRGLAVAGKSWLRSPTMSELANLRPRFRMQWELLTLPILQRRPNVAVFGGAPFFPFGLELSGVHGRKGERGEGAQDGADIRGWARPT
ncbi:hypothetical protein HPB47_002229 [Ixodes persulcatus]|uniref:Uncharacterized protein n=1 Tax=Ixodes persulcatus TaxID=34615 RepID=A0AC60PLU3_IXOPE|nr:hypothetical protein HPB47_002229 [Ixodes persulcatus]